MTNLSKSIFTLSLFSLFLVPNLQTQAKGQCYRWKMINGKKQYTYFDCKSKKPVQPKKVNNIQNNNPISNDKIGWMKSAGISESDFSAVDFIVERESSWNPNSVNSSSKACGLMQFIPCTAEKAGVDWNNPITALQKGDIYVKNRYGNWQNAKAFWIKHNWY